MKNQSIATKSVHSGTLEDSIHGSTISPIYPASSYAYLDAPERVYPRFFNLPNQRVLEDKLAALEGGEAGVVFSSGMAAISTTLLSLMKKGDHAVFQRGLYGGTTHFVLSAFARFGIEYTITEGISEADFEKAIRPNTKLIYLETPSNPLLNIINLATLAKLAQSRNLLTIIDNTFASPINQTPLAFGIDIVLHSATKYLGGHSDLCAGAVISREKIIEPIREMAKNLGGSLNPTDCAKLERSLKTLAVRVIQQNKNAGEIAAFLKNHPAVENVFYPGLQDHPDHDVAKAQMYGFGGMVSFELADSLDTRAFQENLRLILPAMSLGGAESTICSPALASHSSISAAERARMGISEKLLRLSAGLEASSDLIADLDQAFKRTAGAKSAFPVAVVL